MISNTMLKNVETFIVNNSKTHVFFRLKCWLYNMSTF